MTLPLEGLLIVDFSQFVAGPYASLKLGDMGARVIKVENPDGGDLSRRHYLSGTELEGTSTLFHAVNSGKESVSLDLKTHAGRDAALKLAESADVVIQNFRPGVIERLGLGYAELCKSRPGIIFGSISGYGNVGEWAKLPGQDLLAQARSGIMWLSGNAGDGPVPVGLPIADLTAGSNLAQGILGALYRQARTGEGALVETSLLEALVDLQFEFLTTYMNNGEVDPRRAAHGSAHGYLPAPYGVFETANGHIALAMSALEKLSQVEGLEALQRFADPDDPFSRRDDINIVLRGAFAAKPATEWETQLSDAGHWCAQILNWRDMLQSKHFKTLEMLNQTSPRLVNSPLRLDGFRAQRDKLGPKLDANGSEIMREFDL